MNPHSAVHSSKSDHWTTPEWLFKALDKEFRFNDDPCPLDGKDGLKREWGNRAFVNPPYSQVKEWVEYAYRQALKGKIIVMLLPARTDTKWFHRYVYHKAQIRFIKGRLRFGNATENAPFPSMVVVFYPDDIPELKGEDHGEGTAGHNEADSGTEQTGLNE